MVHNPGGDWHPGKGDNPTYMFVDSLAHGGTSVASVSKTSSAGPHEDMNHRLNHHMMWTQDVQVVI